MKSSREQSLPAHGDANASLKQKFLAILQSDPLVNGLVALGVTVGFVHGWLKITVPNPAMTFVFDAILSVALALVFFRQPRGTPFIPAGPIGAALKTFYGICALYLLLPLPDTPPFVISLAALRGWCFATLMFSLGYRLTRSIAQVKGYYYVLMLLGILTAIYGFRQTPQEILKRMQEDEFYAERYKYTFYAGSKGAQLRVFSTFVSSGAFGATMAYVAVICVAMATDSKIKKQELWTLLAVLCTLLYAMILSASRTALVSLLAGILVVAWRRRNLQNLVAVPAIVVVVMAVGASLTGGQLGERYRSLLSWDQVIGRQSIAVSVGWDFMKNNLLGGGLGRGAYSVPSFLSSMFSYNKYVFCDGDLGRLMIEMGILGLLFFGRIIYVTLREIANRLETLRNTAAESAALASAACVVMAIISFPSGSPFLGIPMGAMVWFFLGTFMKLADEQQGGRLGNDRSRGPAPRLPAGKRFRYLRETAG